MKVTFNILYSGSYCVTVEGNDVDEMEERAISEFEEDVDDYAGIDEIERDFDTTDDTDIFM